MNLYPCTVDTKTESKGSNIMFWQIYFIIWAFFGMALGVYYPIAFLAGLIKMYIKYGQDERNMSSNNNNNKEERYPNEYNHY